MSGIEGTVHVDTAYFSKPRPFRQFRPAFSIKRFFNVDKAYDAIYRVANSILGKAATFGVAEVVGASLGQTIGEPIVSMVGGHLGGSLIPIGRVATGVLFLRTMDSKKTNFEKGLYLTLLVGLVVLSSHTNCHLALANGGIQLGSILGKGLGALLGGFGGLAIVQSPTQVHDKNSPWDGYSWSMVRYTIAGWGCDGVSSLMDANRMNPILTGSGYILRATLQTLSYNSNILFPYMKQCIQKKQTSARAQIPLYVKMITNRYCGHSHQMFAKELSGFINNILSLPNSIKEVFALKVMGEVCVIDPLLQKLDTFGDKAESAANVLIRSFYNFIQVLWSSKDISWAHKKFEEALNEVAIDDKSDEKLTQKKKEEVTRTKEALIKAIEIELGRHGSLLQKTFLNVLSNQLEDFQTSHVWDWKIFRSV